MEIPIPNNDDNSLRSSRNAESESTDFDPYFKWLGIPTEEQPPNHYRLLAIPLFTTDLEVIENAADQRMAHLRSVQVGQRAALAQFLLNQVANAKVCLLNPNQKASYDVQLRTYQQAVLTVEATPSQMPIVAETPTENESVFKSSDVRSRPKASKKTPSMTTNLLSHTAGSLIGLTAGYVILCFISPKYDFLKLLPKAFREASDNSSGSASTPATSRHVAAPTNKMDDSPKQLPTPQRPITQQQIPQTPSIGSDQLSPKQKNLPNEPPAERPKITLVETNEDKQSRLEARRDAASKNGDFKDALAAVGEIATLNNKDSLEAKLSFIATLDAESVTPQRSIATELVTLLELAVAEKRPELIAQHVDRMLVLARKLDDQELERRATLIVLRSKANNN